ncbi:MAG: hypothetical protein AAGG72_00090 [Pseudomonadota bacterium]
MPQAVFPVRIAPKAVEPEQFAYELSHAMKRACTQSGLDRHEIAARMAKALNQPNFSKGTLDAYISTAKDTHAISLVRFIAFVNATEQRWLMDFICARTGCTALIGAEAHLAEQAWLQRRANFFRRRIAALRGLKILPERRRAL